MDSTFVDDGIGGIMDIINWLRDPVPIYYLFEWHSWDNDVRSELRDKPLSARALESSCGFPDSWNHGEVTITAYYFTDDPKTLRPENLTNYPTPSHNTDEAMVEFEKMIYRITDGKISHLRVHISNDDDDDIYLYGRKQL